MRECRRLQPLRRQLPPCRTSVWAAWVLLAAAALLLPAPPPARGQAVEEIEPLSFGRIALGPGQGTIRLTPRGVLLCQPHTCLGGARPASFRVTGLPLFRVSVSFSPSNELVHAGGGAPLVLSNLQTDTRGQLNLGLSGEASFDVGGNLQVSADAAGGAYAGSYVVTVEYQ